MTIKWKTEEVTFDTMYEADMWADSIANEIYGRIYEGYNTPDNKIAYSLAFRLASIKEYKVHTEYRKNRYKIWVTFK